MSRRAAFTHIIGKSHQGRLQFVEIDALCFLA